MSTNSGEVETSIFPDHHPYSESDINMIIRDFYRLKNPRKIIVTTEKDLVRLTRFDLFTHELKSSMYYLPVQVKFLDRRANCLIKKYLNMLEKIKATANYLAEKSNARVDTGIILGTGLGGLVKEIEISATIPYNEIPNFPVSTVDGHAGRLIFGRLGNREVLAMQGRFHYYEGYDMKEVTFPVRVMRQLGITTLLFPMQAAG